MVNVVSSGVYLFNSKYQRENWRGMTEVIGTDTIIFPSNSQKEALTYYRKEDQIVHFRDFNGGPSEIWLSRYVWDIFDPTDAARIKIENLGYNKTSEYNFNGVILWRYSKDID
jgi:hypothetical protein